jgi:hypothetical protein
MDRPPIPGQEIVQFVVASTVDTATLEQALVVSVDSSGTATIKILATGTVLTGVAYTRDRGAAGRWCYRQGF